MKIVNDLLKDVKLPKVVRVRQVVKNLKLENIEDEIITQLMSKKLLSNIKPEQKIAITAGSRGIAKYPEIIKIIIDRLKSVGAKPFIIPSMGSHGGASSEGQKNILKKMGITEESMGVPIKSSMEVSLIGYTENNLPVYIDKYANEADGIIIVNRIKLHTSFRGEFESGLMKMMSIGLGKQKGAEYCHSLGFGEMAKNVPEIGKVIIRKKNIPFTVGIIENANKEVSKIAVLGKNEIEKEEPELLKESTSYIARIPFDKLDVLIINEIGKDISGTGFDTNVVGRYHTKHAWGGPQISKISVLNLTKKTQGNANGIGIVDYTTKKVFNNMKLEQTYPNALTSTVPDSVKIPMILENDKLCIAAAVKTCNILENEKIKLVIIKNTKDLECIYVSENLIEEVQKNKRLIIEEESKELEFINGNLILFTEEDM